MATFPSAVNLNLLRAGQASVISGRVTNDLIGYASASLGDVNGDGLGDWAIAGRHNGENTPTTASSAYVLLSGSGWPDAWDLATRAAFRIGDLPTTGGYGEIAVAGPGDINGDGYADVVVGSLYAANNSRYGSGSALVYYGGPGNPSLGFQVFGANAGDQTGSSVAGVGDVNGDGLPDFAVAAQGFFSTWPSGQAASTHIVLGRAGPRGDIDLRNPGADVWRIDSPAGYLQRSIVAGAGDLNGDGLADVAIGHLFADQNGRTDSGSVSVVFGRGNATGYTTAGAPGAGSFRIDGAVAGAAAGSSIAGIGDINGDGLGDLLIGAPNDSSMGRTNNGVAYVVFGGQPDGAVIDLANLGSAGFRLYGARDYHRAGTSVASAGDVNGDGRPDFLVGAPNWSSSEPNAGHLGSGATWLILGRDGGWSDIDLGQIGTGITRFGPAFPFQSNGTSAAGGGDANGDGFSDLLLASPAGELNHSGSGIGYLMFSPGTGGAVQRGGTLADTLRGGNEGDTLLGGGQHDKLYGGGGHDLLNGNTGNDSLYGGIWDDTLFGEDGSDMLNGNAGHDMLAGGWGNDTLYGEDDNDALFGEGGDDTLIMGFGDDRGYGQDDNDLLFGEGGQDLLVAGWGNDTAYGQAGQDQLFGEGGNDSLFGGDADDRVYGQAGDDRAWGEAGNDLVNGGDGLDSLWGGAGADIFFFDRPNGGTDMVMDFNRAEGDRIHVSAAQFAAPVGFQLTAGVGFHSGLDARPTAATATFYQDTRSQALWFDADGIGPGGAHVVAFLIGNPTLTASDIVFV